LAEEAQANCEFLEPLQESHSIRLPTAPLRLADKHFATRVTAVAHTVRAIAFPTGNQAPALAALANRANAAITDVRVIEQEFAFPCHSLMIFDFGVRLPPIAASP
jgi:hypothetical protein